MIEFMKKRINILFLIIYFGAFILVLLPFFLCAPYARASADDWSNGVEVYSIVRNGGGIIPCIYAAWNNVVEIYRSWEGRYFSVFLFAFSPGNWQERYYGMVPYVLILSQIIGQTMFYRLAFGRKAVKFLPFIVIPSLVMQFLYVGDVAQVYFWYVGGIGYTFVQAIAYIQWGLLLALFWNNTLGKKTTVIYCALTSVLGFLISGGNYASAISTLCITLFLALLMLIYNRNKIKLLAPALIMSITGFAISLLSPGNRVRVSSNFAGETNGIIESIILSLWTTLQNIYSWFFFNMGWLVILMALPAVYCLSKELHVKVKHPFLILFFSYGIYSTEIVANIYVEGNTGGWRNGAILYGSYYIFLLFNVFCISSFVVDRLEHKKAKSGFGELIKKYGLMFGTMLFCLLFGYIVISGNYKSTSSYLAYRDYRQGWAKEYARQWDERFEILRDDSVTDPVFHQLREPRCLTLEYADLQLPDGYVWVNEACRNYYGKNSITVLP